MGCWTKGLLFVTLAAALVGIWITEGDAAEALGDDVFAVVDGQEISGREYMATLRSEGRQKFYHGQPPEEELNAFKREIGEKLIDRLLMVRVAEERKLPADERWVEDQLQKMIDRLSADPGWKENSEEFTTKLRERLQQESQIKALEATVREVADPTDKELMAFYQARSELFTTPERFRVSTILLRVPPWAATDQWEEAGQRAQALWAQLNEGAAFEQLAELHSQDASADQGGDLGFLHRDMLGSGAQKEVEELEVGQFTQPIRLLEGYALFKLTGRESAQLNSFDSVRDRAKALWLRESRDKAWDAFKISLRTDVSIQVNERYYLSEGMESQESRGTRKSTDGEK